MVEITSMNCQGLGSFKKWKNVFQYLRKLNKNIYCLQDTHFTEKIENQIRNEWGYKSLFSSYTSNARGVCILFNNNFDFKLGRCKSDENGNYLLTEITIDDKKNYSL